MADVETRVVERGRPPADRFAPADVEQNRGRRGRQRMRIVDWCENGRARLGPHRFGQPPGGRHDGPAMRKSHHRARAAAADAVRIRLQHEVAGGHVTRDVAGRQPSGAQRAGRRATDARTSARGRRRRSAPRAAARGSPTSPPVAEASVRAARRRRRRTSRNGRQADGRRRSARGSRRSPPDRRVRESRWARAATSGSCPAAAAARASAAIRESTRTRARPRRRRASPSTA